MVGAASHRRSVVLTPSGAALLPHIRVLLERAEDLQCRAAQTSGSERVRFGYVDGFPPTGRPYLRRSPSCMSMPGWVLSHAQAAHVADGSLDLAACRLRREDLEHHGIHAWLHGAGRLHAVATEDVTGDVRARGTAILIDDTTCWLSWIRYAEPPARDTGARAIPIDDGGITGPAFFDHVCRSPRPVINSPKAQTAPLPPDLVRRPVVEPAVYQTWSLVWRHTEDRTAVLAAVDAIAKGVDGLGIHNPGAWLPDGDVHK